MLRFSKIKPAFATFLAITIVLTNITSAFALTDTKIFTDTIANTYVGREEATQIIANVDFTDLNGSDWARESIVRSGAFNMVKGYNKKYSPKDNVTNAEALAFVLRVTGDENLAHQTAVTVQGAMPENSPLKTLWSIGYLNLAQTKGLITATEYGDAITADQAALDPTQNFVRDFTATRENVADWLVRAIEAKNPEAFNSSATTQSIFPFTDWDTLAVDKVASMEKALRTGIFKGSDGKLNPKGFLTRAEMAQVLKNMDNIYFQMDGLTKKTGTVGGIKDAQTNKTNAAFVARDIYVRTDDGKIDVLQYQLVKDSGPKLEDVAMDMVTFKDGKPTTMNALKEGDEIEYIVAQEPKTGYYIQVVSSKLNERTLEGTLKSVELTKGEITIIDPSSKTYTFPMIEGLFGTEADKTQFVVVDEKKRQLKDFPVGSKVQLSLKNDVVDKIKYIGEPVLIGETRGIVVENNPELGNLTFIDNNGNQVTKTYLDNDISVEKQQYFERDDKIGYLEELFPNFDYDPKDATIDEIEAGDIVFMRFKGDDPTVIDKISASTNYISKYGKIKQFTLNGDYATMVFEYENKETSWFDVPNGVFVSKDGKPIENGEIKSGDWARLLVNQAILEPGVILESVKEMAIEGDEHFISTIIKGQFTGLNPIQNQLLIQNYEKLSKTGWGEHKNVEKLSLAGKDIEYFQNGKRISLDYAKQYLKRVSGEVYVALENNFSGEKVKRVTFRTERDELLKPDTITNSDNGTFTIASNDGDIETDDGTIIRRHGRLIDGSAIATDDYAVVSLNGATKAAVVDIEDAPDTSAVIIARGRVDSVDDGKSFKVYSMSVLNGNDWSYSPIERVFTIDYSTLFLDNSGLTDDKAFITYGDASVNDNVYNIVINGSHADRVISAPYSTKSVKGTIYEVSETSAKVRNALYYDNKKGVWLPVSDKNSTLTIEIAPNTIVAKNNKVVGGKDLVVGDQIKAMTNTFTTEIPAAGATINAYVLQVEK